MTSLGEELPKEMTRVRDKVMPAYIQIGAAGMFALTMMRADLDKATKAMMDGDVTAMIEAYQSLKEWKL